MAKASRLLPAAGAATRFFHSAKRSGDRELRRPLGLQDDGLAAGAEGPIRQHEPRPMPADAGHAADPALGLPHREVDLELLARGLAGRQGQAVVEQHAAVFRAIPAIMAMGMAMWWTRWSPSWIARYRPHARFSPSRV